MPPRWLPAALLLAAAAICPARQEPGGILDELFPSTGAAGPLSVEALASQDAVRPGDVFRVAVVLTPNPPYHVNSNRPLDAALVPTVVSLEGSGATAKSISYPPGAQKDVGGLGTLDLYVGRTVIVATLAAADTLAGASVTIRGKLSYQACDDQQCLRPAEEPIELTLPVAPAGAAVRQIHEEVFAAAVTAQSQPASAPAAAPASPSGGNVFSWLEGLLAGGNVPVQLAAMFLLGLCLNLTGCTLPSLALTLGFFANQAQGRSGRQLALAAAFAGGMLVFFAVMGGISVALGVGFSAIYQYPPAVLALVAVVVFFSGSLFGFYALNPPKAVYKVAGGAAGLAGAFGMGLVAVILAIPCTAGFLVGILGYCAKLGGNWPLIVGVWLLVGLGMSSPFVILALSPALARRVPRAGDWTELIKKGFGFVLLIVAAYQAKSLLPEGGFEVLAGAVVVAWGAFTAIYGWDKVHRPAGRAAALCVGILLAAAAVAFLLLPNVGAAAMPHATFVDYSPQVMAQAKADGRPVVLKVTARWCTICKQLDRTVYADPRIVAESQRPGGVLFVSADVTDAGSPATAEMRKLGADVPPQTLFYDAAGNEVAPRMAVYSAEELLARIGSLRTGH